MTIPCQDYDVTRRTYPSPVTGKYPGNYLDGDPLRTPMARGSRYSHPSTAIQAKERRDYEPPPNLPGRPIIPNQFESLRDPPVSQPSSEEEPDHPRETPPKKGRHEEQSKSPVAKDGKRYWQPEKSKKSFFKSRPPRISLEDRVVGSKPRGGWYGGLYLNVDKDDFQIASVSTCEGDLSLLLHSLFGKGMYTAGLQTRSAAKGFDGDLSLWPITLRFQI